jgi:hypothetical protein
MKGMNFPPVRHRTDITLDMLAQAVAGCDAPVLFKGLVNHWPIVQTTDVIAYLKERDAGKPADTFRQAQGDGRFFYGEDVTSRNFARANIPLSVTLDRLGTLAGGDGGEHIAIQSAPLKDYLPRVKAENSLPGIAAEPRIWIGNRSTTQIHFDLYDNLACGVAGVKRFVLFPPEQTRNLYMGPFDQTISGVPTSMVDLDRPDFDAHPRFRDALAAATVAEVMPGDVLYIPYMWWHHVQSTQALNIQINYWWNTAEALGQPIHVLFLAMMGLRDLPPHQNRAWKAMFDHFVFHQSDPVADHLPKAQRGLMGAMPDEQRAEFRRQLGKNLQE